MQRLQVKLDGKWQYVYCRNQQYRNPITTEHRIKAVPGRALDYFRGIFGNHEFRIEPKGDATA